MKRIFHIVAVMAITAIIFTGCSKANDNTQTSGNTEATKAAETTPAKEEEETVYPFTYTDGEGREITIEKQPTKVAISYLPHWESLILLGVMPAGTTSAAHYAKTWDAFQGYDLSSVVDLGDADINLELLAQLEPDIILQQSYNKESVENLEKIAPVVVFGPQVKMDWRYSLREIGKVVGKAQKAEEVIAETDQKLADARVKLQEKYNGKTVMLMSLMGEDKYYCAYRPDLYDSETGLGLKVPEGFTTSEQYEQVSMEALAEMNPDYLFVNVFDGDEAYLEELNNNNTVWKSLKASKEGHVYRLDGSGHAASAISTIYTVDTIIDTLLGKDK
ncbi:iron-siderophore ABC transporter substrate-binding protein [Anaerocolumna xylanovorans]|uniref:Iron complex transport system substrate-binding protein n=1 Tax=Anaerocolumna xylanovorans DSM 12503 TaxID=1121345 RepID=A0A1M7Y472_9FIRM|nr:iron-siderophore ABC transporter substrate-binding protein [Anaerocolumna xylanovorans]SHO47096.1 iron complex transport system substrate-binding protein [Anaerocolumna xylanovorans DSM 12503]